MEKQADGNIGNFVHRRISQLKVVTRLMEHELESSKGDVTMDRSLLESTLDTLEIFVEDFESARGGVRKDRARGGVDAKPAVTRLN